MKNKDWGRGRGGGLINFPPLKRGGLLERRGLFERGGGLIEDLRYTKFRPTGTKFPNEVSSQPRNFVSIHHISYEISPKLEQ